MSKRWVLYFRVSTRKQGESGLGLEAQRETVMRFIGDGLIVAEHQEIESGGRADRPALDAALRDCRIHNATLAIAKLDRLARSVSFISRLQDGGVDFVAADMPSANRFTIHILAAVAEHERRMISDRTRAALAAAKVRGTRLGGRRAGHRIEDHAQAGSRRSASVRSAQAEVLARDHIEIIETIRASGVSGLRAIARVLNERTVSPFGHRHQQKAVELNEPIYWASYACKSVAAGALKSDRKLIAATLGLRGLAASTWHEIRASLPQSA